MSPESPAGIRRLPKSDTLMAVYNDHSGQFKFEPRKRTPLVVAYSTDGGRTWPVRQAPTRLASARSPAFRRSLSA
jgi:hypothetical protein